MPYQTWDHKLARLQKVYSQISGEEVSYYKMKPALKEELAELEGRLLSSLPKSLKEVLLNFSGDFGFTATLPDEFQLPGELSSIFSAGFQYSADSIFKAEESRKSWTNTCFPNQDDPYDLIWHHKLGFLDVGNGDFIAFDLLDEKEDKRVVYLSHDGGEGHGVILGRNFIDFMDRLITIGACGPEDFQLMPFLGEDENGLDPYCRNALIFREHIGLAW